VGPLVSARDHAERAVNAVLPFTGLTGDTVRKDFLDGVTETS
jgi:TolB-like protein